MQERKRPAGASSVRVSGAVRLREAGPGRRSPVRLQREVHGIVREEQHPAGGGGCHTPLRLQREVHGNVRTQERSDASVRLRRAVHVRYGSIRGFVSVRLQGKVRVSQDSHHHPAVRDTFDAVSRHSRMARRSDVPSTPQTLVRMSQWTVLSKERKESKHRVSLISKKKRTRP